MHPLRYLYAIGFRTFIYPNTRKGILVQAPTFFGTPMQIMLPAGTDIFLTKGKSHCSEISLAKFLIQNLENGDHFLDVGAHFGYFSLLASTIVGDRGCVIAIEASHGTFEILTQNTKNQKNITALHAAISDHIGTLTFYEFPVLFSEYNSLKVQQYEQERWYNKFPPQQREVEAVTIDGIIKKQNLFPKIIKIDVEGAELKVIAGAKQTLSETSPIIVMEYLEPNRQNEPHRAAVEFLHNLSYQYFIINQNGTLESCPDIEAYLLANKLESDNIVFLKGN